VKKASVGFSARPETGVLAPVEVFQIGSETTAREASFFRPRVKAMQVPGSIGFRFDAARS
jgi:hypothetical protein